MDNSVLKKRLNTFKSAKGTLRRVSDEVVLEVLRAWENWPGTSSDLNRELGLTRMQMVTMIQKGKRLVKSGVVVESEFKQLSSDIQAGQNTQTLGRGIELLWGDKVIRFYEVDHLLDFLKKAA